MNRQIEMNWPRAFTGARSERIVVTRAGRPIALIVGIKGLDAEQIELGMNGSFWRMIEERRNFKTITRAELERRVEDLLAKRSQHTKTRKQPK